MDDPHVDGAADGVLSTHGPVRTDCVVPVKHATASVFLFTRSDTWRLGLIHHPRHHRWMLPGGHVEPHENPAEAALREVAEESGHDARLLASPGSGLPHIGIGTVVAPPLWIVEHRVPAESRHPESHIHVDYLYAALAPATGARRPAELPFVWYADEELDRLDMFGDTRAHAHLLFSHIAQLAAGQ